MASDPQSGHHWVLGNSWQDTRRKYGFRTLGKKYLLREPGGKGGQLATGLPIKPDTFVLFERNVPLILGVEIKASNSMPKQAIWGAGAAKDTRQTNWGFLVFHQVQLATPASWHWRRSQRTLSSSGASDNLPLPPPFRPQTLSQHSPVAQTWESCPHQGGVAPRPEQCSWR